MAQLITATQVVDHLQSLGDQRQAQHLMRFFKCEPGAYGHGDKFLGIKVPETRKVAKQCKALPLSEVARLLDSEWHEVRLCGLLVLVAQFEAQCTKLVLDNADATARRDAIVEFYLEHARSASNWDLVDLSVIVCTMEPLRQGVPFYTLRYAEWHLHHPHDLMHKAVGWLLREMGKRVDMGLLRDFLGQHAATMPRTALRYAIEHMSEDERKQWLTK